MNKNYTIEELEAYLNKELDSAKQEKLEAELLSNPELQEELLALKASLEAIDLANLKKVISQVHKEHLDSREETPQIQISTPPSSLRPWISRIAASLVFVLVGTALVLVISANPDRLISQQIDYVIPVLRSAESQQSAIQKAYSSGDFEQVITLADSFQNQVPEISFLKGLSYLQTNQAQQAVDTFSGLVPTDFGSPAQYYLVEAYLQLGDFESAHKEMKTIRNDANNPYRKNFTQKDLLDVKILSWKKAMGL